MSHLERSLSKERGKSKDQPSKKADKTTGDSSWNFYDQFSGTLPRSRDASIEGSPRNYSPGSPTSGALTNEDLKL